MGLDMYLKRSRYVSVDYSDDQEASDMMKTLDVLGDVVPDTVSGTIMYWRKSNQIHKWFVDKVQNGLDECQASYVSIEQLKELHGVIVNVLKIPSQAENLLPNGTGFFFGGQDYDDYYFDDLRRTKENLESLFKTHNNNFEYEYQASW